MKFASRFIYSVLFLSFGQSLSGQSFNYPDTLRADRLTGVIIGGAAGYGITMTGLYHLWYRDFKTTSFHFFDDSRDWLQMDKAGHVYSAYLLSNLTCESLRMSGVPRKKAAVYAGLAGFGAVTSIEFFDAFSAGWGFSWADVAANAAGSGLYLIQDIAGGHQYVKMKFSVRSTDYPQYRPGTLGSNTAEQIVKDYNGQSYWLSADIRGITGMSKWPAWLNIAAGYSGDGMLGGSENPLFYNGKALPRFERSRQFYLSPDIDFTEIPTRSRFLKIVFKVLNTLKMPAPAVRLQNGKVAFFGIYH